MSRTVLLILLLFGVAVGSCPPEVPLTTQALPQVGAAGPAVEIASRRAAEAVAAQPAPTPNDVFTYYADPRNASAAGASLTAHAIEGYLSGRHTGLSKVEIQELSEVIVEQAEKHGLEPSLVLAVIHVESSSYHRAVSPVGALGLMQILPSTAEELAAKHGIPWLGREMLFDPVINVKLGVAYLRQLSDRYSNVPTALAAYNWGPGRIDRRLRKGDGLPKIYVEKIMQAYNTVDGHFAVRGVSS